MDFIVGLPKVDKKLVIMVIVYCLSKYAHFCALPHPFPLDLVVQIFMDQIFKLHGMPTSIVSNHDPTVTSHFLAGFIEVSRELILYEHFISFSN